MGYIFAWLDTRTKKTNLIQAEHSNQLKKVRARLKSDSNLIFSPILRADRTEQLPVIFRGVIYERRKPAPEGV